MVSGFFFFFFLFIGLTILSVTTNKYLHGTKVDIRVFNSYFPCFTFMFLHISQEKQQQQKTKKQKQKQVLMSKIMGHKKIVCLFFFGGVLVLYF